MTPIHIIWMGFSRRIRAIVEPALIYPGGGLAKAFFTVAGEQVITPAM